MIRTLLRILTLLTMALPLSLQSKPPRSLKAVFAALLTNFRSERESEEVLRIFEKSYSQKNSFPRDILVDGIKIKYLAEASNFWIFQVLDTDRSKASTYSTGEPYYEAVAKVNNQLMPLRSFVVDNFSANKYRIFDVNADGKKDLILINDDQGSIIFNVFVYLAETSPESISGVSGLRLARSPKPGTQPKCSLTAENLQASYLKSYSVGACERFTIVVERKYHFCQKSIFETFAYDCTKNDFKELTK